MNLSFLRHAAVDTWVITKRNLIRYVRVPQLMVFSTIQPVMVLLLFNYVFGGAIRLPPGIDEYINFLLPGVLIQISLFGNSQTTVGVAEDLSRGLVDRFRSLPMARIAVIAGRTLADAVRSAAVVGLLLVVATIIGFRFQDGFGSALLAVLLVIGFTYAFAWISAFIGLIAKDAEAAQAAGFVWVFPLVFASSVFVPVQTMPSWLQGFAANQPVSVTANAVRSFTLGGAHGDLLPALLWIFGLIAVFIPLNIFAYKRSTSK